MMLEIFGLCAVGAMVLLYALENRSPQYILGFAVACAAASLYAVLIQSWPFAGVEALWAFIAVRRWRQRRLSIVSEACMTTSHVSPLPIACNLGALSPTEREQRATLAQRLQAQTQEVRETATGYALRLPAEPSISRQVFELVLLERRCCPFLQLQLTFEPALGALWLTLGDGPDVKTFLRASGLVAGKGAEAEPCCSSSH